MMKNLLIDCIIVLAILVVTAQATEYYISSTGIDSNPGTIEKPWKTIKKVNGENFQPGDIIRFERGAKYYGGLFIDDSGDSENPITFTAYGVGISPYIDNRNYNVINGNAIQVAGSYIIIDGFYFKDGLPANNQKGVGARRSRRERPTDGSVPTPWRIHPTCLLWPRSRLCRHEHSRLPRRYRQTV